MINILVTGSSGFIGFHLSNYLLKKKYRVIGIDSHNKYYSTRIKNKRLLILKKNKNYVFKKINLINKKKLENIFKQYKPKIVYHLAGQPGVLYSLKNPKSYYLNNIDATESLSYISKKYKIKKFIFGSSSSIYGDQKKFPIKENRVTKPKNPYAKSKLKSEKIILKLFKNTNIKFTIFRFFTVYGPFGRPDMFIHKFLNSIKYNKKIKLYNHGLNFRDFTFIDDVIKILSKTIKNKKSNGKILNICRSKPFLTIDLVNLILKKFNKSKIKIIKTKFVKGEMLKTHGSNKNLKKIFGNIKFTNLEIGIKKTIITFKKFNI